LHKCSLRLRFSFYWKRDIHGGADWWADIQKGIRKSDYLVCLIAPKTFTTEGVKSEIEFALGLDPLPRIICLYHSGMTRDKCYKAIPQLQVFNDHRVLEESAAQYEAAVNFALNSMGLKTYG
jgi:hypothetical protein